MFLENFIESLADFMNVSTSTAAYTMTTIIALSVVLAVLLATGGKHCEMPIAVSTIFVVVLCTVWGWIHIWISALICLTVAVATVWYISKSGRGEL